MRISDWSSDVCSSDLQAEQGGALGAQRSGVHGAIGIAFDMDQPALPGVHQGRAADGAVGADAHSDPIGLRQTRLQALRQLAAGGRSLVVCTGKLARYRPVLQKVVKPLARPAPADGHGFLGNAIGLKRRLGSARGSVTSWASPAAINPSGVE